MAGLYGKTSMFVSVRNQKLSCEGAVLFYILISNESSWRSVSSPAAGVSVPDFELV